MTVSIVLASASPARRKLLHAAGIEPSIVVSAVDEDAVVAAAREAYGDLAAEYIALVLARAKAEDVATEIEGAVVVGCDSVLELDGEALGKPADAEEATRRWQAMRGRSGVLHTGHCVRDRATDRVAAATASNLVHFAEVTDEEIAAYVATGEPLHVAGAFTVDGLGGAFVRGIEGDHHNVVGVSLPLVRELVAELGHSWTELWAR